MSEPYSPNYLDSLGIEYIKEDTEYNNWDKEDYKNSLLKKKYLLEALTYEMKKRELKNKIKVKKRLLA